MKYWVISDTHFGHRKMEEYCGRPSGFEYLIFNRLIVVRPGDLLIHLGDFCIGKDAHWHTLWNDSLGGVKKILVRGNHDQKTNNWYYSHGWDAVCDNLSIRHNGGNITFSHIPVVGIKNKNIHGHYHNNLNRLLGGNYIVEGEKERNDKDFPLETYNKNIYKLVAIEDTEYKPVLLDTLIKSSI